MAEAAHVQLLFSNEIAINWKRARIVCAGCGAVSIMSPMNPHSYADVINIMNIQSGRF